MGLFGELRCKYPLPDLPYPELQDEVFQTIDLDIGTLLDPTPQHTITKEGQLLCHYIDGDRYPEDAIFPFINFYTKTKTGEWIEYIAEIRDGWLKSLERLV